MATDGVKIIDGDTAHDTYWSIMDLYDSGATVETIRKEIPFPQPDSDYYDDFDYEIYTTAYALAFWEIGFITDDIVNEVKKVMEKGACVKVWTEECDAKEGKKRQKELDKLWTKINAPNTKIRKRKKYKQVEKFLFEINDVLTFQLEDGNFYATIVLSIDQYRGHCTYYFGKIMYKNTQPPTIQAIEKCKIIGCKIGMSMTAIDHKDLINITNKFQKIGKLNLIKACENMGSMSGASTFEDLTRDFNDLEHYLKVFKDSTFEIEELLEK